MEQDQGVAASPPGSQASPEAAGASSPSVSIPNAQLPDFASVLHLERDTPIGGSVRVGLGVLHFDDGREEPSVAIRLQRPGADDIEFALMLPSFGVLLECMMDVFAEAQVRASAIEARRAETAQTGSVGDESAGPKGDAQPEGRHD